MAKCDACGTTIVFGGIKDRGFLFCSAKCKQKGDVLYFAEKVPIDILEKQVALVHSGNCPKCGGNGPVEVHTSYTVWSFFMFTTYQSHPHISCLSCGIRSKIGSAILCAIFGWWGFPLGLIYTPVQLYRNIAGIFHPPNTEQPSDEFYDIVRMNLAEQAVAEVIQKGIKVEKIKRDAETQTGQTPV